MATLSPPLLPHCDMGQECEAKTFVILMSGRPDRMISNACGFWGENVVGVGMCVRVWGDRACQSDRLTDRQAVGTGDRGHPRPSGAFYGFIKPLTPHHSVRRKCSGS